MYALVYVPVISYKRTCVIYASDHAGVGVICDARFPERDTSVWRGCIVVWWSCERHSLALRYDKPREALD